MFFSKPGDALHPIGQSLRLMNANLTPFPGTGKRSLHHSNQSGGGLQHLEWIAMCLNQDRVRKHPQQSVQAENMVRRLEDPLFGRTSPLEVLQEAFLPN